MKHGTLGARSDFSIGESILKVQDYVQWGVENGCDYLGLCDTNSISNMPMFTKACLKEGIKPVIGVRLCVVENLMFHKTTKMKRRAQEIQNSMAYIKVWVNKPEGIKDVTELLSIAHSRSDTLANYYYVPRVSYDQLGEVLGRGNLTLTTGDVAGVGSIKDLKHIDRLLACNDGDTYVELTPVNTPYFDRVNDRLAMWGQENDVLPISIRPAFYKLDEESENLDVMATIISRETMTSKFKPEHYVRNFSLKESLDHYEELRSCEIRSAKYDNGAIDRAWIDQAHMSANALAKNIEYVWAPSEVSLPEVYGPNDDAELVKLIKAGWKNRLASEVLGYKPTSVDVAAYKDRLNHELKVIKNMGFARYFLLVEDLVTFSKKSDIKVGPGRGSVGGSLVAYLLGITDVDPIRFGLLFERFINPDRLDLPDADLDFQSTRREEVISYLIKRYGKDYVAGIANYTTIASGGSMRDVGRVYGVDNYRLSVSKLIPKPFGSPVSLTSAAEEVPELEKFSEDFPQEWKMAVGLEGTMRSYGRHAAGVVVGGEPLMNRAVFETHKDGCPGINWDKRVVEEFGLVKIDILGLQTLDQIAMCLQYIEESKDEKLDLLRLSLDDERTMKAFGAGETTGVFQFESAGMRELLRNLAFGGTLSFEDLCAATSLYRPGPKESGLMEDYVAIRQGLKEVYYEHPSMKSAMEETLGVMIYQEQVMRVFTDVAGFSLSQADHARKAMGKKDEEKMEALRPRFIAGAAANAELSMDEEAADDLFNKIIKFAAYGFNKSHAVEYSVISYWTMYLKVYFPQEYFASSLSIMKEDKLEALVQNSKEFGIVIMPPDVNISTDRFELRYPPSGDCHLYAPFNRCKGISENGSKAIIKAREEIGAFTDMAHFRDSVPARLCTSRGMETLEKVGAFASTEPTHIHPLHMDRRRDQMVMMPGLIAESVKADRLIPSDDITKQRLLADVIRPCQTCRDCDLSGGVHPIPTLGSKAAFMVVADCPNWSEENEGKMMKGKASNYMRAAMKGADLKLSQGYFTSLVKSPKSGKVLGKKEIKNCAKWLDMEIELLRPPIIITLGSSATRHFLPGLKGGAMAHTGRAIYDKDLDATILVGFNPAMISFNPSKQAELDDLMRKVATIME
tara:strand:- start:7580 stop:10981 length:3402 start_codon:yes stop_codon:yes gene_type:complete